jgi:hypothetical protein
MNHISLIARSGNPRFAIAVDGRPLAQHFVGRGGAHPDQVFVLGWSTASRESELEAVEQLLGQRASTLSSARVPVLVCEQCGDLGCGALSVRVARHGSVVTWTDWAYENGYEPAKGLDWLVHPEPFEFELTEYQGVLADVVPSG